jgi:hypothetical protein
MLHCVVWANIALVVSTLNPDEDTRYALDLDTECLDFADEDQCATFALQLRSRSSFANISCALDDRICLLSLLQHHQHEKQLPEYYWPYFLPPAESYSPNPMTRESPSSPANIMTLYHVTSPTFGRSILQTGFRPGHTGWCGAGIYFATTAQATNWKAIGPDSHKGFMIEAHVNVGRIKSMPPKCYTSYMCATSDCLPRFNPGPQLEQEGFDSIFFNPGDGPEYVVFRSAQIVSMKGYLYKSDGKIYSWR